MCLLAHIHKNTCAHALKTHAGQLGQGDNSDRWTPTLVQRLHTSATRFYDLRMSYLKPWKAIQVWACRQAGGGGAGVISRPPVALVNTTRTQGAYDRWSRYRAQTPTQVSCGRNHTAAVIQTELDARDLN